MTTHQRPPPMLVLRAAVIVALGLGAVLGKLQLPSAPQSSPRKGESEAGLQRVEKSLPIGSRQRQEPAKREDDIPGASGEAPRAPAREQPSPVYPVVRRPSPPQPYDPVRPTMTVAPDQGGRRPMQPVAPPPSSTNSTTKTAPKKKKDDDDDDEEEEKEKEKEKERTAGGRGDEGKKPVHSGDPWGDFVFPTRGPRPNWMSSDASVLAPSYRLVLALLPVIVALL